MGTFSSIQERKVFSGEMNEIILYCAGKINHNPSYKVDELNEDEGIISCLYLGMLAQESSRGRVTKEDTYTITLTFNQTPSGVECVGSISNPLLEGNVFAKPMAKKLLSRFFKEL